MIKTIIPAIALLMILVAACKHANQKETSNDVKPSDSTVYYTFKLSEKVMTQGVLYRNRYGIIVSGDLYLPQDIDTTKKYASIIVGKPYGGVKEQGTGIYAQTMAEPGFVTLAFDES